MSEKESFESFDGELEAARQRLRDLAAAACQSLDARLLNVLSYHIAVYIDVQRPSQIFTGRMTAELKQEQARSR